MINTIINNDCLDALKEFQDNSIDTLITDPPYGMSFMGKKWDYDVPSVEIWKECLRVLKPGGTAMIFAGSRTQHRMAVNVEDAGFILKDCIMWLYGSGFPKATDISKQLDKGHERKVIGKTIRVDGRIPATEQRQDLTKSLYKTGIKDSTNNLITAPATPEAKLWNGWKSHGLKPAYEPILVAIKPNEGTYANNALKHKVSGLWIDGGRIEGKPRTTHKNSNIQGSHAAPMDWGNDTKHETEGAQGRFPANIILDEEAGKMLDEQSGESKSSNAVRKNKVPTGEKGIYSKYEAQDSYGHNDKGGASRFFYCAKASKSERNKGCEELAEKQYSHDGRKKPIENGYQRNNSVATNHHPTVKPLKLMEYLCKLTKTPMENGGIVLDPFAGSGTTGIAAKNVGRDYILIERDKEYCKIAEARLNKLKD